jgi:hypothetical protein
MELSPEKLNLELGDIIQISAPGNDLVNERIYLIDYIDNDNLRLIDDTDLVTITLTIKDGLIADETIKEIAILDKPSEKGYIKQNNIKKGQWIEIYFGGDVPTIITGQVTDIIEDMMELNTWPSEEKIYIDFGYRGIPIDLPITKITIRKEAPVDFLRKEIDDKSRLLDAIPEEDTEESKTTERPEDIEPSEDIILKIPTELVKGQLKDVLAEADVFSFGEDVESIRQEVVVAEEEKRFAIDVQANDLLDEMLSTIPNIERTEKVLNKINIMINRFKELRKQYSIFNESGNIEGIIKKKADYKPLVDKLYNFNENLYWLLPVVKNRNKLYNVNVLTDDNDIEIINLGINLQLLKELQDDYYNNTIQGSKYKQYIIKQNPFYTPFSTQSETSDLIIEKPVNTNINVIVNNIINNLQEFYSSVASNDNLKRQRFVMTKYNLGLDGLQTITKTGTKMITKKEELTRSDNISLTSIMILPEPYVRYSHISLPSTNIYDKTNLNHSNLSYWKLLRKNTSITNHIIPSLEQEVDYDNESFLTEIKNISLAEGLTDDDKYKKFLQIMIPRTKNLFSLMKKYIKNGTNLKEIISYLEPFVIYKEDISFKQYEEIVQFINENVARIKLTNSETRKDTNTLRSLKESIQIGVPLLLSLIYGDYTNTIKEHYKIDNIKFNSELYKYLIEIDYGEYFMNNISLEDKELLSNIDIKERLNSTIEQLDNTLEKETSNCKDFILAKKYITFDELSDDNGSIEVYFDHKYDNTPYDIIEEYRIEQDKMNSVDFNEFLKNKLIENIGLNEEKALEDAEAMIQGKRLVRDGHYAVLELIDEDEKGISITRNYYKRTSNNWEFDKETTDIAKTDEQKLFCNIRNTCIQLKDECDTIEESKDKIMKENMEKIVKTLSDENIEEREKLIKHITIRSSLLETRLKKLIELRTQELLKNNNILYKLGLTIEDSEIIVSPYISLFDSILSEQDLYKKSQYIIRFVNENTRTPFPDSDESPYWFYCPITNTKLMPSFFFDLANTLLNGGNYSDKLDKICAERGELSDDGDKWVDKYSGYTIKMREFSVEEGFDEGGFKIITNELLDEDHIVPLKDGEKDLLLNSKEAVVSKKIAGALAFYTGINIGDFIEIIVIESTKMASKQMPTKDAYEKQVEKMKLKGKKMPSYENKYNQFILYFTSLYFLIIIQTSIPGLKTRKTFPGCAKDFGGYPLDNSNYGGITYISCVLKNISSSQTPWDSIKGISADSLKRNLMTIYDKILYKDSLIQKKIKEKQIYLIEHPNEDDIPSHINVTKWNTFLPPLTEIKIGNIHNLADTFTRDMMDDLKKGKMQQFEKLGIIRGKIVAFSLKIIEEIQNIVKKEPALLETKGGEPFLQNVCCNDNEKINTLKYFTQKNTSINIHNDKIKNLSKMYIETIKLANSPILLNNNDTKMKYPKSSSYFTEETIYKAFIYYCNYNKDIPISDSLKILCSEQNFDFNDYDEIKEKIKAIKSKGMLFNEETLQHLLKIIARENYVNMSFDKSIYSSKESILHLLINIDEINLELDDDFVKLMREMIENYDELNKIQSTKLREIRNFLIEQSDLMKNEIIEFLNKHSSYSASMKKKLLETFDKINEFRTIKDNSGLLTENENTIINMYSFLKNTITELVDIYPNIITNQVNYENVKPPLHWKLSQVHNNDITVFIRKNYTPLKGLYGNKEINEILKVFKINSSGLSKILKETIFSSSLNEDNSGHRNLFEYYFVKEYITYLFYYTFKLYIDIQNDEDIMIDVVELEKDKSDEMIQVDILTGDKLKLKEEIARILMSYLEIVMRQKNRMNLNKEDIMDLVLKSKEKEKNTKTRQLKELTDEERKADAELRKGKLGRWNVGLQKGLTQYVKDNYDVERKEMEKEALIDLRLGEFDIVNDMNKDIFAMDMLEQDIRDKEADKEAFDMSGLPDDDDFGDQDGDEEFY